MSVNNELPRILAYQPFPLKLKLESDVDSAVSHLSRTANQAAFVAAPHRIFGGTANFPRTAEAVDPSRRADALHALHALQILQTLEYQKFGSQDTACSATNETCKPIAAFVGPLTKRPPEVTSHRVFAPIPQPGAYSAAQLKLQLKLEQRSSGEDDSEDTTAAQQQDEDLESLSQLAVQLVEENRLSPGAPKAGLSEFEKLFVSNLVYIMSSRSVAPELDSDAFVREVNSSLRHTRPKRKDAQLRFVYKRAVKILMSKVTGYIANKTYQMHNFASDFLRYYFPALSKEADREDVMDTSYASKKKYLRLFALSPLFKQDFLGYALPLLQKKYAQYSLATYDKMARYLRVAIEDSDAKARTALSRPVKSEVSASAASSEKQDPRQQILFKRFKRVPWSIKELDEAVDMVHSFSK